MKTLRKTKKCLNCGQILSDIYDFCPLCGQENTDNNVSFKQLAGDFFSNYFSLDSKFLKSIKPFFINPGYLTNSFNNGKRKSYANPVRLYIIISFLYFFILSLLASDFSEGVKKTEQNQGALDSLQIDLSSEIDSVTIGKIAQKDSLTAELVNKYATGNSAWNVSIDDSDSWPFSEKEWETFLNIKDNRLLTDLQIFDSLKVEHKHAFTKHTIKQVIRVYKSDKEYLFAYVLKNSSLMMFIMLPIFAVILKSLYIRRKILYINHLVHSLHIHSFSFLIYGLAIALSIWVTDNDWIGLIALVSVTIYSYISFITVYNQNHKKTLIKFVVTGFIYSFLMLFALILELFLSFLIF